MSPQLFSLLITTILLGEYYRDLGGRSALNYFFINHNALWRIASGLVIIACVFHTVTPIVN